MDRMYSSGPPSDALLYGAIVRVSPRKNSIDGPCLLFVGDAAKNHYVTFRRNDHWRNRWGWNQATRVEPVSHKLFDWHKWEGSDSAVAFAYLDFRLAATLLQLKAQHRIVALRSHLRRYASSALIRGACLN